MLTLEKVVRMIDECIGNDLLTPRVDSAPCYNMSTFHVGTVLGDSTVNSFLNAICIHMNPTITTTHWYCDRTALAGLSNVE